MVQAALVDDEISLGRAATEAFDEADLDVRASFWLYYPDAEEWRLLIATPLVDRDHKAAFLRMHKALREHHLLERFPVSRLTAISPKAKLVRALRKVVPKPGAGQGVRVPRGPINRMYVNEAYVYRLN